MDQLRGSRQHINGPHVVDELEVQLVLLAHQLELGLLIQGHVSKGEQVFKTVHAAQPLQGMVVLFCEWNAQLLGKLFPRSKVVTRGIHDHPIHVKQASFERHGQLDSGKTNWTWYWANPSMGFLMMLPT